MLQEKTEENPLALDPRIEELFKAGVHFGYAKTRRHPKMRDFIAGVKSNIEIFHLEKVLDLMDRALGYVEDLGREGQIILWVGTKPAAEPYIREVAEVLGHPFVDERWLGGTLTNFDIIKKRITYWQDLEDKQKKGELEKYTKQEQMLMQKEIERLSKAFRGLVHHNAIPAALFVVDPGKEINAVHEAHLKNVPVVALMNSDCDPSKCAYPIPGNDNAPESIKYVLEKMKAAYLKGKESHGEH